MAYSVLMDSLHSSLTLVSEHGYTVGSRRSTAEMLGRDGQSGYEMVLATHL